MVIVDSSVWIEAARRDGDLACKVALEGLLEEYEAVLSSPVLLEVLGGARRGEREKLRGYFDVVTYWCIEEIDWQAAVRNSWALRDAGCAIPWTSISSRRTSMGVSSLRPRRPRPT